MASSDEDLDFTVGDYQLLDGVTRDAVSETWLASPAGTDGPTRTLLRLGSRSRDSASVRRAFLAELRQLLEAPTPGLVRLREVARSDAGVAAVYEDTLSISLEEMLEGEPVPPAIAVRWLTDLAAVLSVLQGNAGTGRTSARLTHGDLRPRNVLVTHGGVLALRPTGLGAAWRELAAGGEDVGHLAPEQRDGSSGDARSEVWALARLGCLMLDKDADREGEPRVPSDFGADLARVLELALSENPTRRPANPGAFGSELREALGKGAADQADVSSWFDGVWGRDLAAQRIERRSDLRAFEAASSDEGASDAGEIELAGAEPGVGAPRRVAEEADAEQAPASASELEGDDRTVQATAVDEDGDAGPPGDEEPPRSTGESSNAKRKAKAPKRGRKGKKRRNKPAAGSGRPASSGPSVAGEKARPPASSADDPGRDDDDKTEDEDDDEAAAPLFVPEKKNNLPLVLGGVGIAALALLAASALGGSDTEEPAEAKPAASATVKAAGSATPEPEAMPEPSAPEPKAAPEPEPEPPAPEPEAKAEPPPPEPKPAVKPKPAAAAPPPPAKPAAPAAPVKKPVAAPAPAPAPAPVPPATTAAPAEKPPAVAGFPDAPGPKPFKPKPPETGIPSGI